MKSIIFLFGAPGAGKGVSAQILKEKYGFRHLSMGECLRCKIFSEDDEIMRYRKSIENGRSLIPCEVVNKIYADFIDLQHDYHCIIDGYPRTTNQLHFLKNHTKNINTYFVFLEANNDLLLKRLLSRTTCSQCSHDYIFEAIINDGYCNLCNGKLYKRITDNDSSIMERIKIFNDTTRKILPEIEKLYRIYRIDTNKDIHIIYKDILKIVN